MKEDNYEIPKNQLPCKPKEFNKLLIIEIKFHDIYRIIKMELNNRNLE